MFSDRTMACVFMNISFRNQTTSAIRRGGLLGGNATTWTPPQPTENLARTVENFILTRLFLVVCIFGLVGNILNLVVLSQKALTYKMGRMERSVYYGLIGLAASDMLICISVMPNVYVGTPRFSYASYDFRLFYIVYENAIVNTFLLSSTWLTVTMATSRYVAVCHPLKARQFIGKRFAVTSLIGVIVVCVIFNLPRYFRQTIATYDCLDGSQIFIARPGKLRRGEAFERVYRWFYFVAGILAPLVLLIVCNAQLIRALRRAGYVREMSRASQHNTRAANRLTLTLVIIVVMYIVLFIPGEIINFLKEFTTAGESTDIYNLAVAFFNLLQAVNSAFNFVLYSAVNTHFRHTIYLIVCCRAKKAQHSSSSSNRHYGSVTGGSTYV